MDLAALIIALMAFIMATANLIIYLAKHEFSTHRIQMVQADSLSGFPNNGKVDVDPFDEFDVPSAMDVIMKDKMRSKQQ